MTANLENFTHDLDRLLEGGSTTAIDPALQAAVVLRSLEIDAEAAPDATLRSRWIARNRPGAAQKRNSWIAILKVRPVVAVLLALLILLVLSGVAYAFGRSWGYIPGYGIVDQNASMRVLAQPVSQTREGITITIHEMILTSDRLFATITTEDIPSKFMLPMDTKAVTCRGDWVYQLPDGSQLSFEQGSDRGRMDPLTGSDPSRMSYRTKGSSKLSKPVNVNQITEMTLHIPCAAADVLAGALPENWEFHLRFVPAPAAMLEKTAMAVYEYLPSPAPARLVPPPEDTAEKTGLPTFGRTPSPLPAAETSTPKANPISITKVIDAGDSFILIGEIARPQETLDMNNPAGWSDHYLELRDASGQQISWEMPMDIDLDAPFAQTPPAQQWAMKFNKNDVKSMPVTVKYVETHQKRVKASFDVDAGIHPQFGDEWQINRSLDVDGHPITLATMRIVAPFDGQKAGGYELRYLNPDQNIAVAAIDFSGYPSDLYLAGGGSSGENTPTQESYEVIRGQFDKSLPEGSLVITVDWIVRDGEQTWTLQWQPGEAP